MAAVSLAFVAALAGPAAAEDADQGSDDATSNIKRHSADPEKTYRGVRRQQGRVRTNSDQNTSAGKIPRVGKAEDITLKRGILSGEVVSEQRRALKPLTTRVDTRAMRTAETEYAEKLRLWAIRQDKRLQELQKIRAAYDRLKEYRDRAAERGEDTSRIDPRLDGMKRKMTALSEEIQLARAELQETMSRYQAKIKYMSHKTKSRNDTAMAVIRKMGG